MTIPTALILAAGLGSRLRTPNGVFSVPKPLLPVAGRPLIAYALENAEQAGCQEAVIVLGHEASEIQGAILAFYKGPLRLRFVYNPLYALQNGISVLAAEPYLSDPFLLLMADHLIEPQLMRRIRQARPPVGGALLAVDFQLERIFDLADATKVLVEEDRIRAIGKDLSEYNAIDTGLFLCTHGLLEALRQARQEQDGDASLSDGVRILAQSGLMIAFDIEGAFWQDVDTAAMHAYAESQWRALMAAQLP
ncbi:MAG: NTP transferase domain-containing protein [Bacteroidota bacterium]|nr:NTP transferase domain-containing protein [Bacteroidota bacterium]MDW8137209.1 NTP transferase domain-containing protein [Bacteroidota bacterium]